MEISKVQHGDVVEIVAAGRLDEYWASHLAGDVDKVIREGAHQIRLNMSSVTYLSSAGIGMLLDLYKQLKEIDGSFLVTQPSAAVRTILEMTRLSKLLITEAAPAAQAGARAPAGRMMVRENAEFEVLDYLPDASLNCRIVGDPALLDGCRYEQQHARKISFPETALGLGLGAFGSDFEDCRGRFGEFLAAAGTAAYLPTDGSNVADYLISAGTFVPEVNVLYGLACEGQFARLARFETAKQARAVKLTEVVDAALEIAGADTIGMVMVAEAAGLVGAALRRSPVRAAAVAAAPFGHPEIRKWISFTADPAHAGSLCLVVGIISRGSQPQLAGMLRPLGKQAQTAGHFHAAAFSYRPMKKGEVDLRTTVRTLFETQRLQGVLHLLADHREAEGAGESEWVRGACWVGPIREVIREDA